MLSHVDIISEFQNKKIDQFVNIYKDNMKQKDAKWYELSYKTIGGSELAAIMGISPFSDMYSIVKTKLDQYNGLPRKQSMSCWWGNVFEEIIIKICEIELGNKVKGNNICIQMYEGHRNSPDGYMVVYLYIKKDGSLGIWTTDMDVDKKILSMIVLLEFKCPITRKVTDTIPNYIIPQLQSGISVSPIVHKGLFVDSLFRKCSLNDLDYTTNYDKSFHKTAEKLSQPICIGIIKFYAKKDFVVDHDIPIDIGCEENIKYFEKYMNLASNGYIGLNNISAKFIDGRSNENMKLDDFNSEFEICIAILPWKLFDLLFVPINKQHGFMDLVKPLIKKAADLIDLGLNNVSIYKNRLNAYRIFSYDSSDSDSD